MDHQGGTTRLEATLAAEGRGMFPILRKAVAQRRAVLAFQPVMQAARPELPAFHEGSLQFFDSCGTWLTDLPPREVHEATELGRSMDCLALELGLQALAEDDSLRLAIDMSAHSIDARRWRQILELGLAADPTIAERLILQISETSVTESHEKVVAFTHAMQAQGVSFALADFRAGFTSFRYLRQCHFDMVKIDSQFCKGIADDPDNEALTAALLLIARQFDLFSIATGVANEDDARHLTQMGIDCLQGPHFGLPATEAPWRPAIEQRRA